MDRTSLGTVLERVLTCANDSTLVMYFQQDQVRQAVASAAQDVPSAVSTVDIGQHGLGAMLMLQGMAVGKLDPGSDVALQFCTQAERLLLNVPTEFVVESPAAFVKVCIAFADICVSQSKAISSILPLKAACDKLASSEHEITAVHHLFVRACIVAKSYKSALMVINKQLFELDSVNEKVDTLHILLYFYYAGICNLGLRRHEAALQSFDAVFAVPQEAVISAVSMEAYKRYVVTSLIVCGRGPGAPRYLSSSALRQLKSKASVYVELANLFEKGVFADLAAYVQTNQEAIHRDQLLGLVKQSVTRLTLKSIQDLTQTYSRLSLSSVAQKVKLPEGAPAHTVEKLILSMIDDDEIQASLHQTDGMVTFEEPDVAQASKVMADLNQSLDLVQQLGAKLQDLHQGVQLDKGFIQKMGNTKIGKGFDAMAATVFDMADGKL